MAIPVEVINEMVEMYMAGHSVREVAEEFGRAPSTVYAVFQDAGVELRKESRESVCAHLEPKLVEWVVDDYVKGVPVAKMIKMTGLSQHTIYQILEEKEVPTRASPAERRKVHSKSLEEAIQKYQAGDKLIKIYVDTGVGTNTLYAELYRRNIPLRREMK